MSGSSGKKKIYIVMSPSWRYDDNYYNTEGGGVPHKAFLTRDEARQEQKRITRDELKDVVNGNRPVEASDHALKNFKDNLREIGEERAYTQLENELYFDFPGVVELDLA